MDKDGEVLLSEILEREQEEFEDRLDRAMKASQTAPNDSAGEESKTDKENHSQWALGGNGRFTPVGSTVPRLTAGVYEPYAVPGSWGLEKMKVASDGIYELPDMATNTVLEEVRKFWSSEERYRKHSLLYKRGVLLWGPPGSGKTVAVKMLMTELVKQDGVVVVANSVNLTTMCLKAIRRIEPKRNLIVVLEDLDETIAYQGEAGVLSLLDGENSIDNILNIATTNYPEKLGPRIINRPSRFDRRVYVGMPTPEARAAYLTRATQGNLVDGDLERWVADTKDMSIAHLRELVAAVWCLDQPYDDVIDRLKKMGAPVKASEEGFNKKKLGFGHLGG